MSSRGCWPAGPADVRVLVRPVRPAVHGARWPSAVLLVPVAAVGGRRRTSSSTRILCIASGAAGWRRWWRQGDGAVRVAQPVSEPNGSAGSLSAGGSFRAHRGTWATARRERGRLRRPARSCGARSNFSAAFQHEVKRLRALIPQERRKVKAGGASDVRSGDTRLGLRVGGGQNAGAETAVPGRTRLRTTNFQEQPFTG